MVGFSALFSYILCFALFYTSCSARPLTQELVDELEAEVERRASTFAITGYQSNGLHPRLEIRDVYSNNADQWNILVLGMQAFQSQGHSPMLSYYQIAGIHGFPNINWDGVGPNTNGAANPGYCPHNLAIFPCWHRAYLALFEQELLTNVQKVVNAFPSSQRQRWANAASTLRLPFFDPAAKPPGGNPVWPYILSTEPTMPVTTPTGKKTITNPFFRFDFNPVSASDFVNAQPWASWAVTLRAPNSKESTASSSNNLVASSFEQSQSNLQSTLFNLFTRCNLFSQFSNNDGAVATPDCHQSIESFHDQIHGIIGGQNLGHMGVLPFAAFDPSFWIHHANIDRIFAMWQVIYPDTYNSVSGIPANDTTYTIQTGQSMNINTPLTPFHRDTSGDFLTPALVRDVTKFGYTYQELQIANGNAQTMEGLVNRLYSPGATGTSGSTKKKRSGTPVERGLPDLVTALPTAAASLLTNATTGGQYEYAANIAAPKNALGKTYYVYVFLGEPTTDASGWMANENMLGFMPVFVSPVSGMSSNMVLASSVSLTQALSDQVGGALHSLAAEFVVPFLQTALQWRVAADGQEVDLADVGGLQVSVVSGQSHKISGRLPKQTGFQPLAQVTHGKIGGLALGQELACNTQKAAFKDFAANYGVTDGFEY